MNDHCVLKQRIMVDREDLRGKIKGCWEGPETHEMSLSLGSISSANTVLGYPGSL